MDSSWAGSLLLYHTLHRPSQTRPGHTSFLQTQASESWDFVLVADRLTQKNQQFLENLKKKGFRYEVGQLRAGAPGCRVGPGQGSGEVASGLVLR